MAFTACSQKDESRVTKLILETHKLCKHYAGLKANHNVDLQLQRGEIHALIGPNGAGKSTLIAQLSGELLPSKGTITLNGRDVTQLPAHRRAHIGLSRSFQISSVFNEMTVFDNLALALQPHFGHSFRFWQATNKAEKLNEKTRELAGHFGLRELLPVFAGELAHGEKRQLEVGMTLAGAPEVLLLDEPMAGIGSGGTKVLTELLLGLRGKHTILLVEHDMQAVFTLADRISVLVYGELIATGTVDEIRSNTEVQKAYLGTN